VSRLQEPNSSNPPDLVHALLHEGWNHHRLQRPLAAWASWQRALKLKPDDPAVLGALEHLESASDWPAVARASYKFQTPTDPGRRARWDALLSGRALDDLDHAASAFATLVEDDPADIHARLNLAFCHAWRGRNLEALTMLEAVVNLAAATDFERAVHAWTLAELLRLGAGAETVADDLRYAWVVEWSEGKGPPADFFESWPDVVPVVLPPDPTTGAPRVDEGQQLFEWLDRPLPAQPPRTATELPRVLASVVSTPRVLRLSSPDSGGFAILDEPAYSRIQRALRHCRREKSPLPIAWADAGLGTFRFPAGLDGQARGEFARAAVEHYYEDVWVHLPRFSLDGRTPLAASTGDIVARAKLAGVVLFREQLGARPSHASIYQGYPFDRLRRRLGMVDRDEFPNTVDLEDLSCASPAELDALDPDALPDVRLADAVASANGLRDDARTARFAAVLLRRSPVNLDAIDLRIVVAPLVRVALRRGDPADALDCLDRARGLATGEHARTFAIWSAEAHARTGSPQSALRIYQELLDDPSVPAGVALDGAETLLDGGYTEQALPLLLEARARAAATGARLVLQKTEALLGRQPPTPSSS
jgi:tetratricopeptide (TPR) repeat protein